ncbi:hypothetical protein BU15DRAFT_59944 [Melanogaster broomeanus]|nr:hypothetical protein BU15DRAFT_59944 [Melanogaster broomeanus]
MRETSTDSNHRHMSHPDHPLPAPAVHTQPSRMGSKISSDKFVHRPAAARDRTSNVRDGLGLQFTYETLSSPPWNKDNVLDGGTDSGSSGRGKRRLRRGHLRAQRKSALVTHARTTKLVQTLVANELERKADCHLKSCILVFNLRLGRNKNKRRGFRDDGPRKSDDGILEAHQPVKRICATLRFALECRVHCLFAFYYTSTHQHFAKNTYEETSRVEVQCPTQHIFVVLSRKAQGIGGSRLGGATRSDEKQLESSLRNLSLKLKDSQKKQKP